MNRRTFAVTGATLFATWSNTAFAQRRSSGSDLFVSTLTGAEIDFTESGFTQHEHVVSDVGTWERLVLDSDTASMAIDFVHVDESDLSSVLDTRVETLTSADPSASVIGPSHLSDGGFALVSMELESSYLEYQLGAFPDFNLMITFVSTADAFHTDFSSSQTIALGGEVPFLFTAESEVETLDLAAMPSESTGITRTPRGSAKESSEAESEEEPGSTAATSNNFITHISGHRQSFLASMEDFYVNMEIIADENTSEINFGLALTTMITTSTDWLGVPDEIAKVAVPTGNEEIGDLYTLWGQSIAAMGQGFLDMAVGGTTADALIAATDEWKANDLLLATAIGEVRRSSVLTSVVPIESVAHSLHGIQA